MKKFLKFIRKLLRLQQPEFVFQVKESGQTRYITFDEWYRERKNDVFIQYRVGNHGKHNFLIMVHPIKNERFFK